MLLQSKVVYRCACVVFVAFNILTCVAWQNAPAHETFSVTTASAPPFSNDQSSGFIDVLAMEIFKRIGKQTRLSRLPPKRALINLNRGIDDAHLERLSGLDHRYPGLRIVPEPIITKEQSGFTTDTRIRLQSWDAIKLFNVAYVERCKLMDNLTARAKSVAKVRSYPQLFEMLRAGRADIVFYNKLSGRYHITRNKLKSIKLIPLSEMKMEFYMYVNHKHEPLIPSIVRAIRAIKADGTYAKIYRQTLKIWDMAS